MSSQRETTEGIETALATLQPIRDLAKNWDIDIASWWVFSDSLGEFEMYYLGDT